MKTLIQQMSRWKEEAKTLQKEEKEELENFLKQVLEKYLKLENEYKDLIKELEEL